MGDYFFCFVFKEKHWSEIILSVKIWFTSNEDFCVFESVCLCVAARVPYSIAVDRFRHSSPQNELIIL